MADTDPRYPCSSIEDDFNYGSCVASASVHIRMAFLRKVYSILSLQVLLTTVTSAVFLYFEAVRTFVHESPALILVFALGSLGLIFALTLHRHKHPLNLYLLFAFVSTLILSLPLAVSLSFQNTYTVGSSDCGNCWLFAVLWILCLAGFLRVFFHSESVELVLASLGALLFCGFIIYDTHSLMYKLSPEEYVLAAISLYLDVINLFLHLLRFLEAVNKK
ncbi:hypothetical protein U0070_022035 [Myodes glareolus]|uniref:Protein lifeguard 4 n=1 Tax=Myodes glareolus TaxID=447135 RepID=A0AAW0I7Y0_MYOGA